MLWERPTPRPGTAPVQPPQQWGVGLSHQVMLPAEPATLVPQQQAEPSPRRSRGLCERTGISSRGPRSRVHPDALGRARVHTARLPPAWPQPLKGLAPGPSRPLSGARVLRGQGHNEALA